MANIPLEKNHEIAKRVRELSAGGVTVKDIFTDIQAYASAPGSLTTFYKYYRDDLYGPKIEISRKIGNKVANQALDGDPESPTTFKSQELWLRTQGGWTPKEKVETQEVGSDEDEAESAIESLMKLLGKED